MAKTSMVLLILAGGLFANCAAQQPDDGSQEAIDKAIASHGGKERLRQFNKCRTTYEGTVFVAGKLIPLRAESWEDGPKAKHVLRMTFGGKEEVLVEVISGKTGWRKVGDDVTEIPEDEMKGKNESTNYSVANMLCDLVESRNISFKRLKEEKIDQRAVIGVRVSEKGTPDRDLYFDSDSRLLTKVSSLRVNGRHKGKLVEEYFGDYQDVAGAKIAHKRKTFVDGKKFIESDIKQIEVLKNVDASIFAKP